MSAAFDVLKALRIAAAEVGAALLLLSLAQYAIALACIALSGDCSVFSSGLQNPIPCFERQVCWWVDIHVRAYSLLDS